MAVPGLLSQLVARRGATFTLLAATLLGPRPTAAAAAYSEVVPLAGAATETADDAAPGHHDGPGWTRNQLGITLATVSVHAAFAVWTWAIWYRKLTPSDEFLIRREGWFGADTYAGGADKLGHFLGNYALTRGTSQLLEAAGLRPVPRLLLANGLTFFSYLMIELKDGKHARFGFSPEDMVANLTGNLVATAFELWPALDDALDLRLHYVPSDAYVQRVTGDEANVGEDYSGMRFELLLKGAFFVPPPRQTPPALHALRYLMVGVGYATRGYKPVLEPNPLRQLSVVVALDVQTLLDELLYDRLPGRGRRLMRFATEHIALPYTTVEPLSVAIPPR
ncbi:MAG: DUF2279 domain-containing protein [Deltaproteobacteria bacterium]|nr:DUF2279 domain-containing protein [Deltaproteobacteria bacterium]